MKDGDNCHFFPLTTLQIGDLQSYLSRLTLYLAPESRKFYILVDNRPWLINQDARTAHLWQLMVTKSRLSPFANTRTKRVKSDIGRKLDFRNSSKSNNFKLNRLFKWFSVLDAALCQKRALLPVKKLKDSFLLNKELHKILFGFIVFEVSWSDVRGINYLNELQTDTSLALEAKLMRRWEFDSIEQASSCISSWYSGTCYEHFLLQEYLDSVSNKGDVFYDAQEDMSSITPTSSSEDMTDDDDFHEVCNDHPSNFILHPGMEHIRSLPWTPPVSGPYKRRKIMKSSFQADEICEEACSETVSSPTFSVSSSSSHNLESENTRSVFEATNYKDVLILFKFNDHDLPFKLKDIIMSDLRLLTLLEYGLPSWVIFLQSYPVFCKFYRPWMCPLARTLYVLISITTVLIGFYDLYKNVPLLKVTASRLFGPFFDWIETWEMISRIRYLGTMLFLHNFEKAVKWFLVITRSARSLFSVLVTPVAGPILELVEVILPVWNLCLETMEELFSVLWIVLGSSCSIVANVMEIVIWPFWLVFSTVWRIATLFIYPIVWLFWEIFIAPARLILAIANFVGVLFSNAYYFLKDSWSSISFLFKFASASEASVGSYESSIWRSLWNDLFSQVFRAIKSILYGFVAFFTTCNRHRLSIYNHIQEFLLRVSHVACSSNLSNLHHEFKRDSSRKPFEGGKSMDRHKFQPQESLQRRRRQRSRSLRREDTNRSS